MISVSEAWEMIAHHPWKPTVENVPLAEAEGRVLAQDVLASRDFPPFDRVTMDGMALRLKGRGSGHRISIESTHFAGDPSCTLKDPNACIEVMTGATLPKGTDTVIPVEHYDVVDGQAVLHTEAKQGQNIHRQGYDRQAGSPLLDAGTEIHAGIIGVLATEGLSQVQVLTLPPCTIVSTGNELVPVEANPAPHQIRQSNVHVLAALARKQGLTPSLLHLNDEPEAMKAALKPVIEAGGVVLLSGGVSKGKKDHLPDVLDDLGVQKHFHRVAQRPGKPFWFGTTQQTAVFAFPGNPISATFGMIRYALPWLKNSLSQSTQPEMAMLTQEYSFKPSLSLFLPVQIRNVQGQLMASPTPSNGSGDLAGLIDVDGFIELPPEPQVFHPGQLAPVYRF